MTIQPISAASVALYLTPTDLHEWGVNPEQLDLESTKEIAREAFAQAGLPLEGVLEIEAYTEKCGVLVFARVRPVDAHVYSFGDWEDLLSAVVALDDALPDGALSQWKGRYWLTLKGLDGPTSVRLSEFGHLESADPYIVARLNEYGLCLMPSAALTMLKAHFQR